MSTVNEYFESLRGKSVAVIGMGVSNTPLIRMMLRAGLKVTVCDKAPRERVEELAGELESLGAKLRLGPDYLEKLSRFDVIFRTPGLNPNNPKVQEALQSGSILTSEMELFFQLCPCKIVGVTGSDGKTTTTTLISEFLKEAGYNVYLGGNIGRPLLPDVSGMTPEDVAVVELSSFQLMTMGQSPNVAVFTNLSPNHLDYHHTMEEYTAAKLNIFSHQGEGDVAVFNYPFGWRNDEIGFKINYVYIKRCIGVPGDSVSIRNAHYVNSRTGATGVPKASEDMLRSIPDELLLERKSLKAGQFAGKGDEWTIKDFGPILVPGEGLSIRLDRDNALRYAKVIEYETGEELGISEDGVTIGGNPSSAYTFSGNWYFFVGDNAANSRDSRYFGFVPEDFVIGVVPKYSKRIR